LPPNSALGAPDAARLSRRTPDGLASTRTADEGPPLLERLLEIFLCGCAWISVGTNGGIALVLALETLAFFREVSPSQLLLDSQWTPLFREKHFGLWPLIAGTCLTSGIALLVAVPLGLLAAIYLSEFAVPLVRRCLKPALELLAGIPTIVYGYFALVFVSCRLPCPASPLR
jgi:phosphate transport system permease protein